MEKEVKKIETKFFQLKKGLLVTIVIICAEISKINLNVKDDEDEGGDGRAYLAPPLPPSFTGSRLRRVNSSTLSLNRYFFNFFSEIEEENILQNFKTDII